jgi:hypothetical protein
MPGTPIGPSAKPPVGPAVASLLNNNQSQFAAELVQKTGLDGAVVAAWLLAEQPKSSARAPNGANNWLNIGATGSGNFAGSNPAWTDPVKAADLTAAWLSGASIPGFGTASPHIQAILHSAGQSADTQIKAIQTSGWAASGYPTLASIYHNVTASPGTLSPIGSAVSSAAGTVAGAVTGAVGGIANIAQLVTSTAFWLRIGEGLLGVLLLYLGLHALTGQSSSVGQQAKHVTRIVPLPV